MSSSRKSSPSSERRAGVRPPEPETPPERASVPHRRRCAGSVTWRERIQARAVLIVALDGEKVLGPRFIRLLEEIDRMGSVRQAARVLGLGYRHAIAWIHRAEAVLERPLVVRRAGGVAGGGSGLTSDGILLIRNYHRVNRALGKVVQRAERDILEGR